MGCLNCFLCWQHCFVFACVCVHSCGGWRWTSNGFLNRSSRVFFRQGLSLELADSPRQLASKTRSSRLHLPSAVYLMQCCETGSQVALAGLGVFV